MKWFITGGAGFIGSNLAQTLLSRGETVAVLDNLSSGKIENIERLRTKEHVGFRFIEGDILDSELLTREVPGYDVVVHLAAQGSVQKSFDNVAWNNRQNIDGFVAVLESSHKAKVKQFVYASSCSIYGETDELPISEANTPIPMSPYATSKLCNDFLAANLRGRFNSMQIIGLRFFNIFGPWQDPNGAYAAVIPRWMNSLLSGEQPLVFGDGMQTRDFCYVLNVCNLIANIPQIDSDVGGVFNICSGISTSLNDLYNILCDIIGDVGVEVRFNTPEYKPLRSGDILHSCGSAEMAKEVLGYENRVGLEDGIRQILARQYGLGG